MRRKLRSFHPKLEKMVLLLNEIIAKENKLIIISYIYISERDLRYSKWKMAVERSMKWDCSTALINN